MSFSPKELQIIEWSKQNGKSVSEIKDALFRYRTTGSPADPTKTIAESGFKSTIKDIPSDLAEGFRGATESVARGMQTAEDVANRVVSGETTPVSGTFQTIGAGLKAGAETVGQGLLSIGKAFLSPKTESKIADVVSTGAEAVASSAPAQALSQKFSSLSPEQQRNIQAAGGVAEGAATLFGFGPITSKLEGSLSQAAKTALKESDNALLKVKSSIPDIVPITAPQAKSLVKEVRFSLSDIDPQVETVLQRSSFDDVNRYFQQAKNAKVDPAKATPLELAGNKAEEAYNAINSARKYAVQGKKAILDKVATERVPGNTLNDVMSSGIQKISDRFGAEISANGTIKQAAGRTLQLDASDTKLISEYFSRLNSLGVAPTVKQVDDFVDWAQSQLYKQSNSISKFEVAAEPVVRELQSVTGDLNSRLKTVIGGGYGEVNSRVSKLIELQDELSSALGADARKGGGLMKRLFSPTGGNVRDLFAEIQNETGIDLVKEATLAKFAMEGVGDVRQTSMLKQLDVLSKEASQFDLTKPLSIVNFIREHADMDAQELANEVIRRASSQKP